MHGRHGGFHHFGGGFGRTTYHHHHHWHRNRNRTTSRYTYTPEPEYEYKTLDEVKTHLKNHFISSNYRTQNDFEKLKKLFLGSKLSTKEKVAYLKASIKDKTWYWEKYSDVVSQLPHHTANIKELIDIVIPFHFSITNPTFENANVHINQYQKKLMESIEARYFGEINLSDLSTILKAHNKHKSMTDILDYSVNFFHLIDQALSEKKFDGDKETIRIIKNTENTNRQVFGRHPAAHSIMKKLLQRGNDATDLFGLLKNSYQFSQDLLKYADLLAEFATQGIDKNVIKTKLKTELSVNVHDGRKYKPRYQNLDMAYFGKVFCRLAKEGLLPDLEYNHDMRKAIFKEIQNLADAEQQSIFKSIRNHEDNDFNRLYWKKPNNPCLFGNKDVLEKYWKDKIKNAEATKLKTLKT